MLGSSDLRMPHSIYMRSSLYTPYHYMYINTYTIDIDGRVVTERECDPTAENIVILSHNGDLIKRLGSEFLFSNIYIYIHNKIGRRFKSRRRNAPQELVCVALFAKDRKATIILHNIYLASNIAAVTVTIC